MANSNKNLHEAKIKQDDEFYTIYEDIAREVEHYAAAFYNKVIYCNCDNPLESNFAKYFINMQGEKVCFGTIKWLTSLDVVREPLPLTEKYTLAKYKKYDNFDAVNVDRVCDIPADYSGLLGVPVSFLEKHCKKQFEVLGIPSQAPDGKPLTLDGGAVVPFRRVIIKKI